MNRIRLSVLAVIAIALLAGTVRAQEVNTAKIESEMAKPKMVTPDWHYRWHEGRWWYWVPEGHEGHWMVWTGSTWIPYRQFAECISTLSVTEAKPYTTNYGSYEAGGEGIASQSLYGGGNYRATGAAGSGGSYAGYGWNWGPGTAYRNAPGPRF
jgi:hypothetical protein